jgi:hypothetical protein
MTPETRALIRSTIPTAGFGFALILAVSVTAPAVVTYAAIMYAAWSIIHIAQRHCDAELEKARAELEARGLA